MIRPDNGFVVPFLHNTKKLYFFSNEKNMYVITYSLDI